MKITPSSSIAGIQAASFLLIAVGVIMLLSETRNTGEAFEALKITLPFNAISIIGTGLIILPLVTLLILYFSSGRNRGR